MNRFLPRIVDVLWRCLYGQLSALQNIEFWDNNRIIEMILNCIRIIHISNDFRLNFLLFFQFLLTFSLSSCECSIAFPPYSISSVRIVDFKLSSAKEIRRLKVLQLFYYSFPQLTHPMHLQFKTQNIYSQLKMRNQIIL